jgi:hypothetical protein
MRIAMTQPHTSIEHPVSSNLIRYLINGLEIAIFQILEREQDHDDALARSEDLWSSLTREDRDFLREYTVRYREASGLDVKTMSDQEWFSFVLQEEFDFLRELLSLLKVPV